MTCTDEADPGPLVPPRAAVAARRYGPGMATTLRLRFTVSGWEPDEIAAATDGWVGAATMRKTYSGGLEGSSVAHFVSSGSEELGRVYTAAERIDGVLDDGRRGSFVVYHGALQAPEDSAAFGWIVPGSGTGDLQGLRGTATIEHDGSGTVLVLLPTD